ncbi:hypothetical protein QBC39DRAFT_429866 [Podospora conica]|nr:hypothetical protein QBC39DRAFT_429866 [Schizothecium conicum]
MMLTPSTATLHSFKMRFGDLLWQTALVVASSVLAVVIVLVAFTSSWAQTLSDKQQELSWWVKSDVGITIIVVQVLLGLLTAAASTAVAESFTRLHWNKINDEKGLPLSDLLALSPTTSFMGTARLVLGARTSAATRLRALARVFLTVLPSIAGILLFARTSLVTVFDTASVYDVTSGIGPFNASYVASFVGSLQDPETEPATAIVPYAFSSIVHNLITNSLFSTVADPISCQPSERYIECASYIISGGLSMVAPWTPDGNPDHPLVRIRDVPTIQAEFEGRSGPKSFSNRDCLLLGSERSHISAELCLSDVSGSMHVGLFLCDGIFEGKCVINQTPRPNLTTTMTVFRRQATLLSARSNLTITSLSDLTDPEPIPFTASDISAFRTALSWLMDYSAANIPAQSSILEIFWDNQNSLSDTYIDGILLQNFRSILVFPIWLFNANNHGNKDLKGKILNPNLPSEFYTTAAVVSPLLKLRFDPTFLSVFIALECILLLSLWIMLLWVFPRWSAAPELSTSSFPTLDFLFKAEVLDRVSGTSDDGLRTAEGSEIVKRADGAVVYSAAAGMAGLRERKRVEAMPY